MKKKDDKDIEYRGNDRHVAGKLLLEMELIKNANKEIPVYSFDDKDNSDNKNNK